MKAKFQTFQGLKNEFPELFKLLEALFPQAKKVAIGLSGGSDSMFLAAILVNFWQEKNWDLDQLFFLHCNHQMRKESKAEAEFLVHFFQDSHLKLFTRPSEQPTSEEELRKRRYACFQKYCQKKGIQTLALGHHLNDRIETSMMNLLRGCGVQGLINMQVEDQHHLLEGIHLIRPLLTLTKAKIETACQTFKIPFVQDQSNFDSSTSLRNQLRNEILLPLSQLSHQTSTGEKSFFESWKLIYAELEKQRNADESSRLVPLRKNPYRNAQFAYEWTIPEARRADFWELKHLFQEFKIPLRQAELQAFQNWISNGKEGFREIQGRNFFLSHGVFTAIKAKNRFREKEIQLEKELTQSGIQTFGLFQLEIPERFLGAKLRFPRQGDHFQGKSLSKRAINHKIPLCRRNTLPLVERDGNLIFVFKPQQLIF